MAAQTLLLLIPSACSRGATPTLPEVNLTVTTNAYTVFGATIQDFKRHIAAYGPTETNGGRRDGRTDCRLTWDYQYLPAIGGFCISSATVSLEIKYTVPRLPAAKSVPAPVVSEWQRYITALMLHEAGHSNIAARTAQTLSRTLRQTRVFLSRNELSNFVEAESQRCLADGRNEDAAYDQRTRHGLTQGAVLHSR